MTSSADRGMEPLAAPNKKDYACGYCPASFQTPVARYNHRRQYHRAEHHRDPAIANPPREASVEAPVVGPSEGPKPASPTELTEMDSLRMAQQITVLGDWWYFRSWRKKEAVD